MKNTDFMNLSLPEGADKIDVEIINNDFKKLENEASKHYIKQQIEVDGTATIIGSIGPYVQLENLTDNILNVSIGDELVVLMKGDNRKIRTISGENYGVVTNGAVRITYYINARTYADENFYKKEKVDELLSNVEATVEVDAELSETSENPVQNKVITAELANYATTAEVESKVTEKVAEIVAGAPEDFDTLKELSDWLTEHEDSAASMNSAIQKNAVDIATANENIEKKLDKKAKCVNGADYDSFVATGFYEALGTTETPTQNSPNGNDTSNNFYIIVQQRVATYVSQFAISVRNDTGVYVRTMSNGTWNAWRKLLDNTTEYAASDEVGGAASKVKSVIAGSGGNRSVFFNDQVSGVAGGNTPICIDADFYYNPNNNTLTVPNIESNTTVALKNDVAINKSTLGTQCKNLLPYRCIPHANSGGIKVAVADDGVVTLSGTNTVSFTYNINFTTPMVFDRDVFIVGAEKLENVMYYCKVDTKVNGSNYPTIGTAGLRIPAGTTIFYLYFQKQTTNKEIEATVAPMIVYADVLDRTYEPYKPSLQEQLNSLIVRIEALEGATNTTTEGGE